MLRGLVFSLAVGTYVCTVVGFRDKVIMFEWDEKKNIDIKKRHGVSFEELIEEIEKDRVIIDSPNKTRTQKAFFSGYPFIIPFEIRESKYRLITAWPDRRYKNE